MLASCLPSLEQHMEGEHGSHLPESPPCSASVMDGLVSRLQATLSFQQRLIRLFPPKAGMAPVEGAPALHLAARKASSRSIV